MAEPTLSLSFTDFRSRTARYLGWSPDSADWSSDETSRLDEIVQSGYRQFLNPPVLPNVPKHRWSFLRPVTTLAMSANIYAYTLPDDFGGIEGTFRFAATDNRLGPIQIVGEGQIRALREGNTTTGAPQYAAIRPVNTTTTQTTGQRFEAIFWPTPDAAAYTLGYRYTALVNKLSTSLPYPLGGMRHGETILASCLAVAELEENDEGEGPMHRRFVSLLIGSIEMDRQGFEQEFYGYNADRSDGRRMNGRIDGGVTYNGVSYP